jgi:hypothetical protein
MDWDWRRMRVLGWPIAMVEGRSLCAKSESFVTVCHEGGKPLLCQEPMRPFGIGDKPSASPMLEAQHRLRATRPHLSRTTRADDIPSPPRERDTVVTHGITARDAVRGEAPSHPGRCSSIMAHKTHTVTQQDPKGQRSTEWTRFLKTYPRNAATTQFLMSWTFQAQTLLAPNSNALADAQGLLIGAVHLSIHPSSLRMALRAANVPCYAREPGEEEEEDDGKAVAR